MKNIIKKVTAFAMAFTLLGAGTTAIKTISPKFDTTITASAATQGIYRVKNATSYYSLSKFDNKTNIYNVISLRGSLNSGKCIYSDGYEALGFKLDKSNDVIRYLRITIGTSKYWVPIESVSFVAYVY